MENRFIVQDLAEDAAALALVLVAKLPGAYRSYSDQLVRASGSVALKLAEGFGRRGKDKRHHYTIAYASAREASAATRILLRTGRLSPATADQLLERLDEVRAMTWRLIHPG